MASQFHYFDKLPPELRNAIWIEASCVPRFLNITTTPLPTHPRGCTRMCKTPPPPVLHVNQESRREALRIFKLAACNSENQSTAPATNPYFFVSASDVIRIHIIASNGLGLEAFRILCEFANSLELNIDQIRDLEFCAWPYDVVVHQQALFCFAFLASLETATMIHSVGFRLDSSVFYLMNVELRLGQLVRIKVERRVARVIEQCWDTDASTTSRYFRGIPKPDLKEIMTRLSCLTVEVVEEPGADHVKMIVRVPRVKTLGMGQV